MATEPTPAPAAPQLTYPAGDWRNIFDPKRLGEAPATVALPPRPKVQPLNFVQFVYLWEAMNPDLAALILPLGYATDPSQVAAHQAAVTKFFTEWQAYSGVHSTS